MAANIPFVRGQNVILRLYQDGKPVYVAGKTWDVEENASEIADDVNGENRSRLDKVTNFFSISLDCFQADQEILDKYIEAQDSDDASLLPKKQSVAIQINNRDGTRAAYLLSEAKLGPIKLNASGRSDAFMLNLKIRFRYMKKIQSV